MARWTASEVRRLIARSLAPVVKGGGFRIRSPYELFVREIQGGRQELSIALWDFKPRFDFSFTLGVRLEEVEALTNRFSGPAEYHGTTLTSLTQLEFLGLPATLPARGVVYSAQSEVELAEVMRGVCLMVRERVLPFFEEYRDVAGLNRGLNPKEAERMSHWAAGRQAFDATYHPYRGMAGVAVAYLAGDPRLKKLVDAYRSQMSGTLDDDDKWPYEQLVSYLALKSQGEPTAPPDHGDIS
jgi:hypothetical protein